MKKILLLLLLFAGTLTMYGQTITTVAAGGTWNAARGTINANFEVTSDSLEILKTIKAPINSPTFTGNVTIATLILGATTITSNGTELNILDGALVNKDELNKLVGIGTDTIATRAYARSVGGGGSGTGDLAFADTVSGTGFLETQFRVDSAKAAIREEIANVVAGDVDSTVYSTIWRVRQEINDSLEYYLGTADEALSMPDTVDIIATQNYVDQRLGEDVDLSGNVTIGTSQSNYLRINSEVYFDTTGVMGSDTVALIGIVQGDSLFLKYAALVDEEESTNVDSSLYVTVTRLTDSLDVMRGEIDDLTALVNDLIEAVEGVGVDIVAPRFESAMVRNDTLWIVMDNTDIQQDSVPPVTAFTLYEDDVEFGLTSIDISNDSITIVLDSTTVFGAVYTLDYTRDFPYLQDSSANKTANWTDKPVTNSTPEEEASGLASGLIAYWDFEEASGNITDEVDGFVGTAQSTAATYSQDGIIGDAIFFNYTPTYGSGTRFDVGQDTLRSVKQSVSAWIWLDTDNDNQTIYSNNYNPGGNDTHGYRLVRTANNGIGAYLSDGGSNEINPADFNTDAEQTITEGAWHHVVLVIDGTNAYIYIDGVEEESISFPYDIGYGSDCETTIGASQDNGASFGGRIDELGVWNRALSSSEVTELYNSGAGYAYPFN